MLHSSLHFFVELNPATAIHHNCYSETGITMQVPVIARSKYPAKISLNHHKTTRGQPAIWYDLIDDRTFGRGY